MRRTSLRSTLWALGALLALCGPVARAAPAVAVPAATAPAPDAQLRVAGIARRLLLADAAACSRRSSDFGLVVAPSAPNSWGAPVRVVWPDGPAAQTGLRPGDLVRQVDGVPWSADRGEHARFEAAMGTLAQRAQVSLLVERDGRSHRVDLIGQPRCPIEIRVSAQGFINATAVDHSIVVGSGLVRLLGDDAELAFAVAHEVAHVVLGHTAPGRREDVGDPARRPVLEREADAMAVRLMRAAGYAPEAAAAAWIKIADASRTPLARLMDLHGPYMNTSARTAFLASEAARLSPGRMVAARLSR